MTMFSEETTKWLIYGLIAALAGLIGGYYSGDAMVGVDDKDDSNIPYIGAGVGFATGAISTGIAYYFMTKDTYTSEDMYKLY